MKRFLALLLAIFIVLSLIACGKENQPATTKQSEEPSEEIFAKDSIEKLEDSESKDLSNNGISGEAYSNMVYYVGDDIPAGTYVINCTYSEYGMDVVIFRNEEAYKNFQNADKFTNGEYRNAVETYAWADFYLKQDEHIFIGLESDYLVLLDSGKCEFREYDATTSNTIYSGIYVVGRDIGSQKLNIKCTSDYLQATIFENESSYLEYHKSSRFTIGEESKAIERYSISNNYLSKDDITSVNLENGMVLLVNNGTGEMFVDEGPIIISATAEEAEENEITELVDDMRPEFKEALDSYEAFFAAYCDIMQQFSENPTDLEILSAYTEYMSQYADVMMKFEALENEEMNDAEMVYYLEVSARISQMLLETSSSME